jgi:hypothetical protein
MAGRPPSAARRWHGGPWCGRLGILLLALAGGASTASGVQPTTEDQLVAEVKAALLAHDLPAFEELINWDGASKMKRRAVSYQLRYGFGRPIRSITLEPFPADGFAEIERRGTLKPNMAVSQQLRVVFDEPDNAFGRPPTALFLIGRQGEAYRIALVVPAKRPEGDRR